MHLYYIIAAVSVTFVALVLNMMYYPLYWRIKEAYCEELTRQILDYEHAAKHTDASNPNAVNYLKACAYLNYRNRTRRLVTEYKYNTSITPAWLVARLWEWAITAFNNTQLAKDFMTDIHDGCLNLDTYLCLGDKCDSRSIGEVKANFHYRDLLSKREHYV